MLTENEFQLLERMADALEKIADCQYSMVYVKDDNK